MKGNVLDGLVDAKRLALFLVFLKHPEQIFNLTTLAKETKIPIATVMRLMHDFVAYDLVEQLVVGKTKLYKFVHNKKTAKLHALLKNG